MVMFEMFSGDKPFAGSTSREMIASILNDEPGVLIDGVPAELKSVIYKAIQKDPADRYQSAAELLLDVQGIRNLSSATEIDLPHRLRLFRAGNIL